MTFHRFVPFPFLTFRFIAELYSSHAGFYLFNLSIITSFIFYSIFYQYWWINNLNRQFTIFPQINVTGMGCIKHFRIEFSHPKPQPQIWLRITIWPPTLLCNSSPVKFVRPSKFQKFNIQIVYNLEANCSCFQKKITNILTFDIIIIVLCVLYSRSTCNKCIKLIVIKCKARTIHSYYELYTAGKK